MLIDGFVGISTGAAFASSAPTSSLHVRTTSNAANLTVAKFEGAGTTQNKVEIQSNSSTGYPSLGLSNQTAWTSARTTGLIKFDGLTANSNQAEYASISAISGTNTNSGPPTDFAFTLNSGAGANELFRMTGTGRFGIGEPAPTSKLHIKSGTLYVPQTLMAWSIRGKTSAPCL